MPRRLSLLLLVVSVVVVGAASRFSGTFEFTNSSSAELWVVISGFKHNPPCGTLIPGGLASSFMGRMSLPAQATLTWSEGNASYTNPKAQKHTNVISLLSLSNRPSDAKIVFEFTSNRVWRVSCEKK